MTTETPEGCVRCGDFGAFATRLFGRGVCKDCLETPEGGLLIRYRQDSWGRRDFYVSLAAVSGFFSLAYCIAATTTYLTKPRLEMIFVLIVSAILLSVSLAYLFLFPWARRATMILSLAIPAVIVIAMTIADGVFQPAVFGGFGIVGVIAFVIARSAYRDVRNKLAFKIDVETAELEAYYEAKISNPLAAYGEFFGLFSLVIPILAPLGLLSSLIGLRCVDTSVWPPVGGRATAINGVVISLIGLAWGAAMIALL